MIHLIVATLAWYGSATMCVGPQGAPPHCTPILLGQYSSSQECETQVVKRLQALSRRAHASWFRRYDFFAVYTCVTQPTI